MKKAILFFAVVFSLTSFQSATADEKASDNSVVTQPTEKVRIPEVFGTRQIKDWQVINNKNIIIDTYSYGKYKATFTHSCDSIPFTETIGFMTQGPYALDENTIIVLSGGEQCVIKDLVPYTEEDND